jgi:predicted nucleic acid-binding protein
MIAYPDTSYLCALYRYQANSEIAARHFHELDEPLHIASPLLFEFKQSLRWQSYLHSKDRSKGFDKETGVAALAKFQMNVSAGAIRVIPVEWPDIVSIAERLSSEFTWTEGFRGFDILHIATALHLGAAEFLTFDTNQKKLAVSQGLIVPF